jgi:hypothetical protein
LEHSRRGDDERRGAFKERAQLARRTKTCKQTNQSTKHKLNTTFQTKKHFNHQSNKASSIKQILISNKTTFNQSKSNKTTFHQTKQHFNRKSNKTTFQSRINQNTINQTQSEPIRIKSKSNTPHFKITLIVKNILLLLCVFYISLRPR